MKRESAANHEPSLSGLAHVLRNKAMSNEKAERSGKGMTGGWVGSGEAARGPPAHATITEHSPHTPSGHGAGDN